MKKASILLFMLILLPCLVFADRGINIVDPDGTKHFATELKLPSGATTSHEGYKQYSVDLSNVDAAGLVYDDVNQTVSMGDANTTMTVNSVFSVEHPTVSVADWEGVIGGENIGYVKTISNTTYITGVILMIPGEDYPSDGVYELAWNHTNSTLTFGSGDAVTIEAVDGTYNLEDGSGGYVSAVVDYSELPAATDPNDSITIATDTASNGFGRGNKVGHIYTMYDWGGYLWAGSEGEAYDGTPQEAVNLHRSRDGITWSRVIDGAWWGAATDQDHMDHMIDFNGYLYWFAGCSTGNEGGSECWRSRDGLLWENMISDGWGDPNNENAEISVIYNGYLYIGTLNQASGLQIWRTANGETWEQSGTDGLGYHSQITRTRFFVIHNGALLAGRKNLATNAGMIFRTTDGINWSLIKEFPVNKYIYRMIQFRNQLYALFYDSTLTNWQIIRSSDGINWETTGYDTGVIKTDIIWNNPVVYNGRIYFCSGNGRVVSSKDGSIWEQVNTTDFGDSTNNILWNLYPLRGYLYATTSNDTSGCEMWRMNTGTMKSNSGGIAVQDAQIGPIQIRDGNITKTFDVSVDNYLHARFLGVSEKTYTGTLVVDGNAVIGGTINFSADAESDDDYVIALNPPITSYTTGSVIHFSANTANTGACTLDAGGGAASIKILHDQDPGDNCIESGSIVTVIFDGTNWQLQTPCAN